MYPDDEREHGTSLPPSGAWSPLHALVVEEEVEEVRRRKTELRRFLELKSDGWTPLHFAVHSRNWSLVKVLLEMGADAGSVDDDLQTPLHYAATSNAISIAATLLDYGADPWAADRQEALAVHYAADEGSAAILAAIHAERMLTVGDVHGSFPIHLAASGNNLAGVLWFLEHGADVDIRDRDGNPLLFHAIVGNAEKIVELLSERGADWSLRGESGLTGLEFLRNAVESRDEIA